MNDFSLVPGYDQVFILENTWDQYFLQEGHSGLWIHKRIRIVIYHMKSYIDEKNASICDRSLSSSGTVLNYTIVLTAYDSKHQWTRLGHLVFSLELATSLVMSLMTHLAMPWQKLALTLQYEIACLCCAKCCFNDLLAKWPLLAWYCMIQNHDLSQNVLMLFGIKCFLDDSSVMRCTQQSLEKWSITKLATMYCLSWAPIWLYKEVCLS